MSTSRVKVKICGLSRKQDVDFVNQLLPDYAGFVFAESRRRVMRLKRNGWPGPGAGHEKGGGVCKCRRVLFKMLRSCNLDILQFHGRETSAYWQALVSRFGRHFGSEIRAL